MSIHSYVRDDEHLRAIADIFSALGDLTRLRILNALSGEEHCVCDLVELTGVSQSGVSHQPNSLRALNPAPSPPRRNHIFYRLADEHVHNLLSQAIDHTAEHFGGGRP